MSNEVIMMPPPAQPPQMTVVSRQDVESLKLQRELLKEFVTSQLVEATEKNGFEGDYGVIPGTKKNTLFKQGAEKALRLFRLGVRFKLVDKTIDAKENFAMFIYKAEVYALTNPDVVIAECDGATNSQEVKYKERTEWTTKANGVRESKKVATPVYDVLNTLMKMSQKRALIGATLLATGLSEYFTQDMLEEEDLKDKPQADGQKPASGSAPSAPAQAGSSSAPMCCDKEMMVSRFESKLEGRAGKFDWYCLKCRKTQPREPQ